MSPDARSVLRYRAAANLRKARLRGSEERWVELQQAPRLDPSRLAGGYLTLITGPSKTADIEQTLVKGAHGPRRLVVLPFRG